MIQEKRQLCKACATGIEKLGHNNDSKTCIRGRMEYIKNLSPEEQMVELVTHERLSQSMAEYIFNLALERKKTPFDIIQEEGLNLTNE